jgi:hypothetical protein
VLRRVLCCCALVAVGCGSDERATGWTQAPDASADVIAEGSMGGHGGSPSEGGAGSSGNAGADGGVDAAAGASGSAGSGGQDAGPDGPEPCTLTASGPVVSNHDGQVFEKLFITSSGEPAIRVQGHKNVVIRNVRIEHSGGPGIDISSADGVLVEDVSVLNTGAPAQGENTSDGQVNVSCYGTSGAIFRRLRLTRGSSGVYLLQCPDSLLQFIEGHDFRGPFPRGQLVQWDKSPNGVLEDFSVINPVGSWPEDNVNVYQSTNATVRRGLVDGNNSPSGVGVIFDGDTSTGLVEDVDAVRMGNGCFSNYAGAEGNVFRRTRCRENICTDQGRGAPSSGGLMWAGKPGLTQLKIEDSKYFASCNGNIVWPQDAFAVVEVTEEDFALRPAIDLSFCWE